MEKNEIDQATGLRNMVKGESGKFQQFREDNGDKPKVIAITSGKGAEMGPVWLRPGPQRAMSFR